MRLTIGIDLDNAWFNDNDSGTLDRFEVGNILEQVGDEIRCSLDTSGTIRDGNGNRVGSWVITAT